MVFGVSFLKNYENVNISVFEEPTQLYFISFNANYNLTVFVLEVCFFSKDIILFYSPHSYL
jgi:hypothetical protein